MTNEKSLGPIIADLNMLKVKKILPNLSINMNLTYNGFISSKDFLEKLFQDQ